MAKRRKTVNQVAAENELKQILRFIEKAEAKRDALQNTITELEAKR
jgi:cation transport ATPase